MKKYDKKKPFVAFVVTLLCIVIALFADSMYIRYFNSINCSIIDGQPVNDVNVTIVGKNGGTNKWVKRNYDLYGKTVDLEAQTYEGYFDNKSKYQVEKWQLKVEITSECFLNQAWCGTVEIHQNVNGTEKVQTLDLRECTSDELTLDYLDQGDILIPLSKGDYFIYYPSDADAENDIDGGQRVTIGFILYYLEEPELNNYEVTFNFNRTIMDGYNSYVIMISFGIWLVLFTLYSVSAITYARVLREMQIKESGLSYISDLYSIIYIINLNNDTLTPIFADDESEKLRPKNLSASEQLKNMFVYDCTDEYKEMALEFGRLDNMEERLKNRNSIVFEYPSVNYGWCQIRFFVMERNSDGTFEKLIFTIQNINEEKKELENIASRADEAEYENKIKSVFIANMSHELRTPINTIIGLNTMILRETSEPTVRAYARNVKSASEMLLSIVNSVLDMSKIEADKMEIVSEKYSFRQTIIDIIGMIRGRKEFENLKLVCNISEKIPDGLIGDQVRLKQVITNLVTNAVKYTDEGSVTLSVYGKNTGKYEHLLISVKDTGIGISEENLDKLAQRFTRFDEKRNHAVEGSGIGLNLVTGILQRMGSELHVLSTYGEGSEFYFEINQEITDETCIGAIDCDTCFSEEENYQALFTAPDVRLLVVDDNAMNINVFCELLKETQVQVDTAGSGAEAIRKNEEQKYDIIFMDHMMPEMDGVEALRQIRSRKNGKNAKTPIIMLTANTVKGAKEKFQKEGFDDFLAKPIQAKLLEKKIMEYAESDKVHRSTSDNNEEITRETLPIISGVDTTLGVNYTGGIKGYLSALEQIVNVGAAELDELKTYAEEIEASHDNQEAVKNFRVKIHSMKSSANMIGALQVYGLAAMLEKAARRGNIEIILDMFSYFADEWEELLQSVAECLPQTEVKKQVPPENFEEQIQALEHSIENYDIKNADSAMKNLKTYELDEERDAIIKKIEPAVAALDADKVLQLCDELRRITKE